MRTGISFEDDLSLGAEGEQNHHYSNSNQVIMNWIKKKFTDELFLEGFIKQGTFKCYVANSNSFHETLSSTSYKWI